MPVDLGTLPRVDPGQFGAVGGRDRRADRTVALSHTDAVTQTAGWEERSQVCDEICLALAEVRRRTPSVGLCGTPGGRRQGPSSVAPRQVLSSSSSSSSCTSPHLTSPHLTSPHLTSPHLTSPHLTSPHLTSPHLTSPPRQARPTPPATRPGLLPGPEVQPVRGSCTTAILSAPPRYLVTWHQFKNPQDGSCGTDCPHAQPGNGHVFTGKPVGRATLVVPLLPMPLPTLSSRTERHRGAAQTTVRLCGANSAAERHCGANLVAGHCRGAAHVQACRCCATSRAVRHRGAAQQAVHRCGAGTVAEHHRGAANTQVRCRGATSGAERRRSAEQTPVRCRGASSMAQHNRGAANIHVRRRGAAPSAERHRGAAQTHVTVAPALPWWLL